jgi:hypothetical protein
VAIEVPDMMVSALSPALDAEVIDVPGANMNRQPPMLEKDARLSELVDAPIVMALGELDGE